MGCVRCGTPLGASNASGWCQHCSRKHLCRVCLRHFDHLHNLWCEGCQALSAAIRDALALEPGPALPRHARSKIHLGED